MTEKWRMMQFKLTGDFMHRVGKYGSGEQEHGALGLPWVDLEKDKSRYMTDSVPIKSDL